MPLITLGIQNLPDVQSLIDNSSLKDFLEETLRSDKSSFDEVCAALLQFHQDEGGSPQVPDFEIAYCEYDGTTHTGKIRFEYDVFFTFGCADIYPTQKSTETSKFSIDESNSKLLLYVTDHISRDTLDEF